MSITIATGYNRNTSLKCRIIALPNNEKIKQFKVGSELWFECGVIASQVWRNRYGASKLKKFPVTVMKGEWEYERLVALLREDTSDQEYYEPDFYQKHFCATNQVIIVEED